MILMASHSNGFSDLTIMHDKIRILLFALVIISLCSHHRYTRNKDMVSLKSNCEMNLVQQMQPTKHLIIVNMPSS